ncbi:MAG: rhodanese-like domain-containing protein [Myroides sp.]
MKKNTILILLALLSLYTQAQDFKSDNVHYQTISWKDFFKRLEANPKLVYFDIRSEGERTDSAKSPAFNQGKLRGALETDFSLFEKYYPEYLKYKHDTIYLYCSHSKRSRHLAKRLADSSFVNVVNINGGLSHLNSLSENEIPYKRKYYENNLKYKLVSPPEFIKALNDKNYQILDIRPDSTFLGLAKLEQKNGFGNIHSALHIPSEDLEENLNLLNKNKTILLFDNDGNQSPAAANFLNDLGYKTNVLIFGLENIIRSSPRNERTFLETKYQMILPEDLQEISSKNSDLILIDIREESEFNGTEKVFYKNIGKLKNAVNIPLTSLNRERMNEIADKTIVIYDRMMQEDLFTFAKRCKEYGITDLYLLSGGISQLLEYIYDYQKVELKSLLAD